MDCDNMGLRKRISDRIWDELKFNDMTQKELCEESGVSLKTINAMLYNKNLIRLDSLITICRVLDISIDLLVGLYDE